ncbi:hypothetical protein N7454_010264 [Penicillium verhagenii]|nr:hypothetical protein N7454_010264 [Penicillium verhagenii]
MSSVDYTERLTSREQQALLSQASECSYLIAAGPENNAYYQAIAVDFSDDQGFTFLYGWQAAKECM